MCGIVGAIAFNSLKDDKEEAKRQEAMIYLTTELLQLTQPRGKDATGISVLFDSGDYIGLKMGISAGEFIARYGETEESYNNFVNVWRTNKTLSRMVIGHCRKPSASGKASPEDNNNNHPIKVNDTIGVHNGTLKNHEEIFKNLDCGRDGKVDSEAIFRLVDHYTKNGSEPFTSELIQEVCKRLSGNYSCLTFNGNNPYQMAGFRDSRPMEVVLIKPLKLLLIGSEKELLNAALYRYNKMAYLYLTNKDTSFTPIKKDDIIFSTLADDSLYIFDNRTDINNETKIPDLYITEKIPRINKIWTKSTNSYNYYSGNNSNYSSSSNKTVVDAKTTSTKTSNKNTKSENKRLGMVWNKQSNKYESIEDIDSSKKLNNVVNNVDSGETTDLKTKEVVFSSKKKSAKSLTYKQNLEKEASSESEVTLEMVDCELEDLITDPAKVINIETEINNNHNNENSTLNKIVSKKKSGEETKIIEEAHRLSSELDNFLTDKELSDYLEITNSDLMKSMPLYSLANRIRKEVYKTAWYSGYTANKSIHGNDSLTVETLKRVTDKGIKARRIIKTLKQLILILSETSDKYISDQEIEKTIKNILGADKILNTKCIENTLKEKELDNSKILRKVLSAINNN